MYFFMGFCGALACLVMFGAGFVAGWSACRFTRRRKAPKDPRPYDARAEQDAFRRLQNYSVEDAYGRNAPDETPLTPRTE